MESECPRRTRRQFLTECLERTAVPSSSVAVPVSHIMPSSCVDVPVLQISEHTVKDVEMSSQERAQLAFGEQITGVSESMIVE